MGVPRLLAIFVLVGPLLLGTEAVSQTTGGCREHVPAGTSCADSKVRIWYREEAGSFGGRVDSGMHYCEKNRRIQLHRMRGDTDKILGLTKTDADGTWRLEGYSDAHGDFYAKARRKERYYGIDSHDICYAARSRVVHP